MSKRRVVVFGPYVAAKNYVSKERLSPSEWFHASSVERIKGLDPTKFETVLCGGKWDQETMDAKREWDFMTIRYLSDSTPHSAESTHE